MTTLEKLTSIKTLLQIGDTSQDALLTEYLDTAKDAILSWLYSNTGDVPETVTDVPTKYEREQISACIAGFNISGAEGQQSHSENGISRTFNNEDMLAYIRRHIYPYIGIH